ncbi:MAG TPA: hypothetical protein VLA67_06810 [Nitrospiraceae bacterium]|nr:hypothetical protein [Nitrospiraceae bacterium]
MPDYVLVFLVVAVIAGVLNVAGVPATMMVVGISWILFVIGIMSLPIHMVRGKRWP